MESGVLIYKCRRCGKISRNTHIPNGIMGLSYALVGIKSKTTEGYELIGMNNICNCDDGNLGISDLIGFEKDKKEV